MVNDQARLRPESGFTQSYLVPSPREAPSTQSSSSNKPRARSGVSPFDAREPSCFGLLRDPKPGRRIPQATAMPDPLVFYSWWNEELATPAECTPSGQGMGVRRQVQLHYVPSESHFELFTAESKEPLTLAIAHADGSVLSPDELYVGATVDVLGRPMTLRGCALMQTQECPWRVVRSRVRRRVRRRVRSLMHAPCAPRARSASCACVLRL